MIDAFVPDSCGSLRERLSFRVRRLTARRWSLYFISQSLHRALEITFSTAHSMQLLQNRIIPHELVTLLLPSPPVALPLGPGNRAALSAAVEEASPPPPPGLFRRSLHAACQIRETAAPGAGHEPTQCHPLLLAVPAGVPAMVGSAAAEEAPRLECIDKTRMVSCVRYWQEAVMIVRIQAR